MSDRSRNDASDALPHGTRLESVEEILRAQQQHPATTRERAPEAPALAFRPGVRPPLAVLCVLDDGLDKGELVRIRTPRLVIGRQDGDIVIPHDEQMSGRHAEIARQAGGGGWVWHLNDLNSTNGTFVRVAVTTLKHNQEILLGGRRYRFELSPAVPEAANTAPAATRGWQVAAPAAARPPTLVEMTPSGDGNRWALTQPTFWIGRSSSQCALAIPDDPMLNARHARLSCDAQGQWQLENAGSLNGVWLRVTRLRIDGVCNFQLGEQRFTLRVL